MGKESTCDHNKHSQRHSHAHHKKIYTDFIRKKDHSRTHKEKRKTSFSEKIKNIFTCSKQLERETDQKNSVTIVDDLGQSSSNE